MVENFAQQTANQIVDKIVSSEPNKVEDAYVQLANKLYTDVYKSDPSPKAAEKFLDDVFQDISNQYDYGKSVPKNLSLAWANQQLGHELPKDGFNQNDLKNVASSTDPTVTVLDKRMANALLDQYPDLQQQVELDASHKIIWAKDCTARKQNLEDYLKKGGDPDPKGWAGYWIKQAQCDDNVTTEDRQRMAGVVREVPSTYIQSRLKNLDAAKPMELPW